MKGPRDRSSTLAIIISNLIPLFGVFFLNWQVSQMIAAYWLESVIIGVFNVVKMILAKGTKKDNAPYENRDLGDWPKETAILFFIMHFGIFMFAYLTSIFQILGPASLFNWGMLIAGITFVIEHGILTQREFIKPKKYLHVYARSLNKEPYERIGFLHGALFVLGMIVNAFGSPQPAIIFIVLYKIFDELAKAKKEFTIKLPF